MATQRDYSTIPGWGADLDHANRPAYPKERTPPRLDHVHWTEPERQPREVEVFHSTERDDITPVFGSSAPPSGLSGQLRRFAFRYSENDMRHWLLLLLGDRINMVEGILSDLVHGHIPNLFAEMGGRAEMRYNRKALVKKAAVATAVVAVAVYLLRKRR